MNFEIVGDDIGMIKLYETLRILIIGFSNNIERLEYRDNRPTIVRIYENKCEVTIGNMKRGQIITAFDNLLNKISRDLELEAQAIVGKNNEKIRKYLDEIISQSKADGRKLN